MTRGDSRTSATTMILLAFWFTMLPALVWAAPPSGDRAPSGKAPASTPKDQAVDKFLEGCLDKPVKAQNCDKLRQDAVDILKEDVLKLGSTANRTHIQAILKMFRSDEPVLRIAAADAIGMIGPEDSDVDLLAPATNDPVPDVRHAVTNMLSRGKGNAISLLKQRIMPMRMGRAVEKPADPAKFSMPVAPDSAYLFDSSDATKGRLSYVAKGKGDPTQFFKAKAKKGPYKWKEFQELYRYQIQDEQEALDQAQQEAGKQFENEKPPDPSNVEALTAYMEKLQSVSLAGQSGRMYFDNYDPNLYGQPTVYVLEERQIGQRSYPARYVVVYQELAFRRPGYRLSWMTVPDSAIKRAQATSLAEEQEELANKAEREALKKKEAELDALTKKKDAAEKKQFKKGQEDLEKALGF